MKVIFIALSTDECFSLNKNGREIKKIIGKVS
jgi:hypothetical protein